MPRELCSCGKPIISMNSFVKDVGGHSVLVQEYGCLNKKCDRHKMIIRTTEDSIS